MDGGPINEKVKKKEKTVTINGYMTISMGRTKKGNMVNLYGTEEVNYIVMSTKVTTPIKLQF